MTTGILIFIVMLVFAAGVLFMIVRRAVRMAIKLALVGLLLLVLLVGALGLWWYAPSSSDTSPRNARPSPTRPARSH